MFLRSLLAFLVLPGIAGFALPPVLAAVDPWRSAVWWQGAPAMTMGVILVLWCVRDFYAAGKGTLAPWDPPKHLVIVGLYRYVRNPMYAGVLILVCGWSILLASPVLAFYTGVLAIGFHIRVILSEEPFLLSRFGDGWKRYRANVGRWVPRLRAWRGDF
jgi:protein-S-isoprenylcysteine O-methyltransferase Ste14